MNLKNELRKKLILEVHGGHSYGCVMVYLKDKNDDWNKLTSQIDKEDLAENGVEPDPHITALYGLHANIKDSDIKNYINSLPEPIFKLTGISKFESPDNDVLKFDVKSADIENMNKQLSKNFDHTKTHPVFHAHCTIAYLKKGKADEYIEKLKDSIGIKLEVDKGVYSKANDELINIDFKK